MDDLISRQAAIEALENTKKAMAEQWGDYLLGLENDYHNDSMIDNSNEVKGQMALSDYDGWEL